MHPSISLTPIIAMRQMRMGNAIVSEKIHATTSRAIPTAAVIVLCNIMNISFHMNRKNEALKATIIIHYSFFTIHFSFHIALAI
jgi:hypothetical protein